MGAGSDPMVAGRLLCRAARKNGMGSRDRDRRSTRWMVGPASGRVMEHIVTQNGLSYTCLCCHQVLASREQYTGTSCELDADDDEFRQRRDGDSCAS